MKDQIYVGETYGLAGTLKNGNTVLTPTSGYRMYVKTYKDSSTKPCKDEEELTFDSGTNKYGFTIDTSSPGYFRFRFIVRRTTGQTTQVVVNNFDTVGVSITE